MFISNENHNIKCKTDHNQEIGFSLLPYKLTRANRIFGGFTLSVKFLGLIALIQSLLICFMVKFEYEHRIEE